MKINVTWAIFVTTGILGSQLPQDLDLEVQALLAETKAVSRIEKNRPVLPLVIPFSPVDLDEEETPIPDVESPRTNKRVYKCWSRLRSCSSIFDVGRTPSKNMIRSPRIVFTPALLRQLTLDKKEKEVLDLAEQVVPGGPLGSPPTSPMVDDSSDDAFSPVEVSSREGSYTRICSVFSMCVDRKKEKKFK